MEETKNTIEKEIVIKQSQLGNVSLVISIVSATIFSIIILVSAFRNRPVNDRDIYSISIAAILIDFGITITGLSLGLIGFFLKYGKKHSAIAGLIINLWMIIVQLWLLIMPERNLYIILKFFS